MQNLSTLNPSFSSVLNVLPDGIIWMFPVLDQSGAIMDFEIGYANQRALESSPHPSGKLIGLRILRDHLPSAANEQLNFQHYLEVYETGKEKEYSFYNQGTHTWFESIRTPLDGGVLSTGRDRKAQRAAENKELATRITMESIIESSPNGIVAFKAVRNEKESISDFIILLYNERSKELTGIPEERVSLTLSQLLEELNTSAAFEDFVDIVECDKSLNFEQYIEKTGKWLSLSIAKLDDGILVMLTDITDLKTSQQVLKKESIFSNSMLDASLNGIYVLEAIRDQQNHIKDFFFVRCNRRFAELTGWPLERVYSKSFLSLFPHTTQTGFFNMLLRVLESGSAQEEEMYYAPAFDRWYDYSATRLEDSRVLVSFQEITKQREAALQIEQQKNLLDNILKNSTNGISVGRAIRDDNLQVIDYKTILANDAAIRLIGIPKELYLSKTGTELSPNFMNSPYFKRCVETMESGIAFHMEYHMSSTGNWLEVTTSKLDDDHLIHVFTDITANKEVQLATERSAIQLQTIINRTQSGIFTISPVKDENGTIVNFRFAVVNEMLASYVGQQPENLAGELVSKYFPGFIKNGLFEQYRTVYETGVPNRSDYHYNSDNIDAWIDITSTLLEDTILVTFNDYTHVKKLQLELASLVEDLKRSNRNLEEFAHAASHDLKEPIRKIRVFSERLQQSLENRMTESEKGVFTRMSQSTERMNLLVDDLLQYSQVSRTPSQMGAVNLKEKLNIVLSDLELAIEEKKAVIESDHLPNVQGYDRQLQQLLQNLISNALKYSKPGIPPHIIIRSENVKGNDPNLQLPAEAADKNFVLLTVQDNGIGFDPQYADRIFQMFQRLHGRSEYAGTGVGLSIARKAVENHKGYIWAQSKPDNGAKFFVLLPVE